MQGTAAHLDSYCWWGLLLVVIITTENLIIKILFCLSTKVPRHSAGCTYIPKSAHETACTHPRHYASLNRSQHFKHACCSYNRSWLLQAEQLTNEDKPDDDWQHRESLKATNSGWCALSTWCPVMVITCMRVARPCTMVLYLVMNITCTCIELAKIICSTVLCREIS